jgi:hypothetical protein
MDSEAFIMKDIVILCHYSSGEENTHSQLKIIDIVRLSATTPQVNKTYTSNWF